MTGLSQNHISMASDSRCWVSRYFTFSAATRNDSDSENSSSATNASGSRTMFRPNGLCERIARNAPSTTAWKTKSTREAPMDARGRISRGKYTFLTRFAFSTTDRDAPVSEPLNTFHARIPERMYIGKSGSPFGRITPNTSQNTSRNSNGFSMAHAAPSREEVYLTLTSLRVRLPRISRYRHSSFSRRMGWSFGDSEVVVFDGSSAVMTRSSTFSSSAIDELLQRDVEGRQRPHAEVLGEQAGERGVRRPGGGEVEVLDLLALHGHRQTLQEPDPGQHVEPAGRLRPGHVVGPEPLGQHQREEPLRQMADERRRPHPVGQGPPGLALAHGGDGPRQVVVPAAEHPARPHHEVLGEVPADHDLAPQLGPGVHGDRIRAVP